MPLAIIAAMFGANGLSRLLHWRKAQNLAKHADRCEEELATFPECPFCGPTTWEATAPAVIGELGGIYVKQVFQCTQCGVRARLGRFINQSLWALGGAGQR